MHWSTAVREHSAVGVFQGFGGGAADHLEHVLGVVVVAVLHYRLQHLHQGPPELAQLFAFGAVVPVRIVPVMAMPRVRRRS